jgi:glycosyltransferase involved in cell wall biosynthesis
MVTTQITPQITTIIPTYQRPNTLRRAIQSILNQTYPHFQLCIYDNASGDETEKVVLSFVEKDSRVKYLRHAKNIGSNANFQFGLERVTTPYFSFLSDDDFVLPNFYETVLEGFKKHSEIAFSGGATILVFENGELSCVNPTPKQEGYYCPPYGAFEAFDGAIPNWSSILFSMEKLKSIGHLKTDTLALDIDFLARITISLPFFLTSQPCAIFTCSKENISWKAGMDLFYPSIFEIVQKVKKHENMPLELSGKFEKKMMKGLQKRIFFRGRDYLRRKNYEAAIQASKILDLHLNAAKLSKMLAAAAKFYKKAPFFHSCFESFLKLVGKVYHLFSPRETFSENYVFLVKNEIDKYEKQFSSE